MRVLAAMPEHAAELAALRHALWPDQDDATHREETEEGLRSGDPDGVTFVAVTDCVVGFVEASTRRDYVNGCDTSPVAFLEGLYVLPGERRRGIAAALVAAVERWARERGLTEIASDADTDNAGSHALHLALGYDETERVVYFRKQL